MLQNFFAFALLLTLALALRCPQLDRRPMHNDEAVNAVNFTRPLWEKGVYVYDPNEYHGPTLHYAALPFLWLSPAREFSQVSEKTLRLVTAFFGAGLVLLVWLLGDGLGRPAMLCAGVLTAISPAMVFYSRYFIHEMLLVFFTMVVLAAGWRYSRTRHIGWALLGGVGLGLMVATKETFVIAVGAMGLAAILTAWWIYRSDSARPATADRSLTVAALFGKQSRAREPAAMPTVPQEQSRDRQGAVRHVLASKMAKHALAVLVPAMVIWVVLFTSFFTHVAGLLDSLRSFVPWLHRAGGNSPHIHPFGFYLERLAFFHQGGGAIWSEALILILAGAGMVTAFTGKGLAGANVWLVRFLALYTIILTLAYSAISYKTPWCMLGFLHGMILLAGIGAVALIRVFNQQGLQVATSALLLVAAVQLGWQAWRSDAYEGDPADSNPYAYAQTVPNLLELVEKVEDVAKVHPQGHRMLIKVMVPQSDYWPLPWYFRRFQRVGWWDHVPDDPSAPVMVVGPKLSASLDEKPNKTWTGLGIYGLRPGILLQLCVESELWRQHLQALPPGRGSNQ